MRQPEYSGGVEPLSVVACHGIRLTSVRLATTVKMERLFEAFNTRLCLALRVF